MILTERTNEGEKVSEQRLERERSFIADDRRFAVGSSVPGEDGEVGRGGVADHTEGLRTVAPKPMKQDE
jgi:hypothetical protein